MPLAWVMSTFWSATSGKVNVEILECLFDGDNDDDYYYCYYYY